MTDAVHTFRAVDAPAPRAHDVTVEGLFASAECRYGRMRWLVNDYGVGRMLQEYGEYFEGEVAVMRRILRAGDTVVSAGGNIGAHLVPLSQIVGDSGRVITFEPQRFIREKLLMPNIEMNGCDNVAVWSEALGADYGIAYLPAIDYTVPNNFGGMELREAGPVETPVVPLDMLELKELAILMLDVEGFEEPALRGAYGTIMRCRPYLYVEIDREATREHVLHYMQDVLGYQLLYHTPKAFNPQNFAGNSSNPYGEMCSVMCLGIPMR